MFISCLNDDDSSSNNREIVKVGDVVPEFSLIGVNGDMISSASLRGQYYLLNFFDTGCKDCQKEFPVLQQIYDKYKGDLSVLNVPRSQTADEVSAYWSKEGLTMPYYTATDKSLYYKFATMGIPRTYIVDKEGKVLDVFTDSPLADYDTLDGALQRLLDIEYPDGSVNVSLRAMVPLNVSDEYHTLKEDNIGFIDLFFFDANTQKLVKKVTLTDLEKDENNDNSRYDATFTTPYLRIAVGVYNIFAVANYSYMPENIEYQRDLLKIIDTQSFTSGKQENIIGAGPIMTSPATALLAIDLAPWAGKNVFVNVEMERVMAKLQVGLSQEFFELSHNGTKYADVKITNNQLLNLNNSYYLFQHTDVLTSLDGATEFKFPDNYQTYTQAANQYIVDPLFYQKTTKMEDAMKMKDLYSSWYGNYTTENYAPVVPAGSYSNIYILENTAYKDCQKNGYSVGIAFKASVAPTFAYIYDATTKTLIKESESAFWDNTIYLYNYNFYGSIVALNVASGLSLDPYETYTDKQLSNYGVKQCKFNLGVYETFYTYWIQNPTVTDPMGPMAYSIQRNHLYKITLTGVSGLGESKITPEIMLDNYPHSYVDVAPITPISYRSRRALPPISVSPI
jgi:peroxiredoxin